VTDPRRLREGTVSHYRDAGYYDRAYARRKEDVTFYAKLAAKLGGPVLELGVGTGRVARAIALRGLELVGVDLVPEMLEKARENLARDPESGARVRLHEGDLRSVRVDRTFPLVISPFNVLMHLYTRADFDAAMDTVKAHLAPGGTFAFDVLVPDPVALARDPDKWFRCGYVKPRGEAKQRYDERFEYDPVTQVQIISMAFTPMDRPKEPNVQTLAHRQFVPAELEALLHYNGFEVEARYGDFDGSQLDETSNSQIIVARRRQ
jgi:SAM-dependent methyltransferase